MVSQTARDLFVLGLRNAHAMENQSQELMENQAERLTEFPEVHSKVNKHLEEIQTELRKLEDCLQAFGGGCIDFQRYRNVSIC
jgi:ferritin-like metal-binding protein YciE